MLNSINQGVTAAVLLILAVIPHHAVLSASNLQEKFRWKQVDFEWESAEAKELALRSGAFVPENNLPLGIERWQNKLFVTVPRWKTGVAASLNYVDLDDTNESPLLKPYPSWENHRLGECVVVKTLDAYTPFSGN